ncbi:MAG: RNA pseudouridine synthase [Spirochaetaceae bacterium]|nr:RNA pseudouridine synthase [Spirochaetaceae bacterium]
MKGVPILFENDHCIVCNKPAGLAVQGGAEVRLSLDKILAEIRSPRPLLVHRLDKDVSGVILAAKHKEAAARFGTLFAGGPGIIKRYLAVCAGSPPEVAGSIGFALNIRGKEREAHTEYRKLSCTGDFSLLEIEIGTGRTHQIRRHLARIGNPILGDDKYGNFALNRDLRKAGALKRILLHAFRLVIAKDACGFPLDVTAWPDWPDRYLKMGRETGQEMGTE